MAIEEIPPKMGGIRDLYQKRNGIFFYYAEHLHINLLYGEIYAIRTTFIA